MKIYMVEDSMTQALIVSRSEEKAKSVFNMRFGSDRDILVNFVGTTLLYDEGCVIMTSPSFT